MAPTGPIMLRVARMVKEAAPCPPQHSEIALTAEKTRRENGV